MPGVGFAPHAGRLIAYIIDAFIIGVVVTVVAIILTPLLVAGSTSENTGATAAAVFLYVFVVLLVSVSYFPFFWARGGQTPGMRFFRLRVVSDADGSRIAQVAAASLSFAPDGHAAALWLSPSDLDPQSTTVKSPTADGWMTLVDRSGHLVTIADAWEAYWAPDSTRLVVRAGKESAQRLDVLEAAGTNRDVVTAGPVVVTALSWIPDR